MQAHKALLAGADSNEAPPSTPASASKRARQVQHNGSSAKQDVIEIESEAEGIKSDDSNELEITGAPETAAKQQQRDSGDGANGHEDRHPLFTECKLDSDDERTETAHKRTPPRSVRNLSTVLAGRRPSDPRLSAKRNKDRLQWVEDTPPSEDEPAGGQPAATAAATTASSRPAEIQRATSSPAGPAVGTTPPKPAEQAVKPAASSEDELEAELDAWSESDADEASTTKRKSPPRRRRSSPINRKLPPADAHTEPAASSSNDAAEQLRKKRKAGHDSLQNLQRNKEELVDLT